MGTLSFRKAYGALKDTTKVGLAKVNSGFKELDIAIVKATNHVECPPKERHVRCIFSATSVIRPRTDVAYCIHALAKRLSKTKNWIVALKTLIVIHRTLREGDPTFRDELLSYSRRGNILQISNFKDDSSPTAWDCSAWTRAYALFIEERLECYRVLKYDIETERLTKTSAGASKVHSRTRLLNGEELLEQLPALQQLLNRLIGCQPDGAACCTYLVQYALALVLKESFKIYCAINDGIINLVDIFFDMSRHDAVTALDIYKRAGKQAESLSEFYENCKSLDIARTFQFPTLRQPPPSFLATMEEYIKEAPNFGSIPKRLEFQERDASPKKSEEPSEFIKEEQVDEEENNQKEAAEPKEEAPESPPLIAVDDKADFLGLSEAADPRAAGLEECNALALEIAQPGNENASSSRGALTELSTTGWELSLATTPSSNISHIGESKLGGGFDKLLLDSLYEDDAARRQIQYQNAGYGNDGGMDLHNPFEQQDPFVMSNSIAPPTNMQIAMTMQQQQQVQYQQMKMQQQHSQPLPMVPYGDQQPQYPYQQMQQPMSALNPFGDGFSSFPQNPAPQQGHNVLL